MKNTKKLTSLFAALAMTAQVGISTPLVMAEEVAEETTPATKLGLIYENDGASGWNAGYDYIDNENQKVGIEYLTENETTDYMHFTSSGSVDGEGNKLSAPMVYASLGDDKIKIEEGHTIVTEMMLRTESFDGTYGRPRVGYSFPEDKSLTEFTYINDQEIAVTGQPQKDFKPNLCSEAFLEFLEGGNLRFGLGTYPDKSVKVTDGKWLKAIIKLQGNHQVNYKVIDPESGKVLADVSGQRQIKPESGYFENIALYTWMKGKTTTCAYTDVDYIKVYNLPTELADNYADYTTTFDEEKISDIKVDGVAIDEIDEATEGTVTFSANGDISVVGVSYTMLTGDKDTFPVEDYVYENNTITFPNGLVEKAEYTVALQNSYGVTKFVSFNSVWEDKIGLIYNQEAETNTDWILGSKITEAEESSEGYKKYLPAVANDLDSTLRIPMGDNKIKFTDDKVIVIETKVKANKNTAEANSRLSLVYNAGINVEDLDNAKAIEKGKTTQAYSVGFNHNFLVQLYEDSAASTFKVGYASGSYSTDAKSYEQTKLDLIGGLEANTMDGNNEYTLIAKLDKMGNRAEIIVKKDGEKIAEKEVTDLGWVSASDFLENVSFNSVVKPLASYEVDYVKVYNVPKSEKDNYAKFDKAYDEVEISNIKVDGVAIEKADDVKTGTVTFDSSADVTVKEVYYTLLKGNGEKVAVTDYEFADNTVTFPNGLTKDAKYTVVVDLGNCVTEEISFNTEWINPMGLILNLDGTETDAWVPATGTSSTVAPATDEDGTTYARMTVAAANDYMLAKLPDEGIKYKEGETIIIDTRVRGKNINSSNDARLQIKWNMPEKKGTAMTLKYNGKEDLTGANNVKGDSVNGFTTTYSYSANHLAIGEFANKWIRFSNGNPPKNNSRDDRHQNNWKSMGTDADTQDNKWFRAVIKMGYGFNMEYTVYDENNNVIYNETGKLHWIEQSDFLKNITMFSFSPSGKKMDSLDVDYLKIYNVEAGTEDNFKVQASIDGVDIKEVKRVDVNKANIEINTDYDVNNTVISYTAWDGTKATLENGVDYTVTALDDNNYTIEFTNALVRSASYTVVVGEAATFGFETELDPQTLYYDGFANATSLEDWEITQEWSETVNGVYYAPQSYEGIEVKDGSLVVKGDDESDIRNVFPDRYYKITAGYMYAYKYGKTWKDYEVKFNYSIEKQTQINLLARYKTTLNAKNQLVAHGLSSRQYIKYGEGTLERLYFGAMTGHYAQPMQGSSDVVEYDVALNSKKDEELKVNQRRYDPTMQLKNRYETTIKVLGNGVYYAVKGLDDDLFYESLEDGALVDIIASSLQTPGTIALTNGTNDLKVNDITVLDLGLTFAIEGNTKAVTNDGIKLVFNKEIASTDGLVVKNAEGEVVQSIAILADDNKTVTLKVAAVAGEYTVEVAGVKAVDGTAMQEAKTFNMITTEGSAYSMEIVTEDGTATCTISHPEVLAGVTLYIATYDVNGSLVSVDSAEITSATTTVTVDKASTVKTFLWKGMKPVEY